MTRPKRKRTSIWQKIAVGYTGTRFKRLGPVMKRAEKLRRRLTRRASR
jgi:hypothetical protein